MHNTCHQPLCVYLVDLVETKTVCDQYFGDLEVAFGVFGKCKVKRQLPILLAKHKDTISTSMWRA